MNGEPFNPENTIIWKSKPPIWRVQLIDGTWWHVDGDKKAPNAFHRFMHRLVFGLKWERI